MSTTDDERTLHIEYDGKQVELAKLDDLDIGEMATVKKLTGMTVGEQAAGLRLGDPDCWAGLVLVSLRREDPSVTLEQVQSIKLMKQFEAWDEETGGDEDVPLEIAAPPEPPTMPFVDVNELVTNGSDPRTSGLPLSERSFT